MKNNNAKKKIKLSLLAQDIANGLKQAIAIKKGRPCKVITHKIPIIPKDVNVKAIRQKLQMTQEEFTQFGFSISAIRHWESHRRNPEGSARILLKIIEKNPKIVTQVLQPNH